MRQSSEMGKISFNYLPASPLNNGWKLALKEKPALKHSVPPGRPDGLAIQADDAIDHDVEKYQRSCNRVEFVAKLSEHSYAYIKVRLTSKDNKSVLREGWITCDVGTRPPRKESRNEWVVCRKPEKDGWTRFNLSLPEEVSKTFGQDEGLRFSELLGFRLRGSLSISPIGLYRDEPLLHASATPPDSQNDTALTEKRRWSRSETLTAVGVVVALIAILASFFVPEFRRLIGLEEPAAARPAVQPSSSITVLDRFAWPIAAGAPVEMMISVANAGQEVHASGCYVPVGNMGAVWALQDQTPVEERIWGEFVDNHPKRQSYGAIPQNAAVQVNLASRPLTPDNASLGRSYRMYFVGIVEYSDSEGDHQIEHCSYVDMADRKALACQHHNGPAKPTAICD
jgi:hypothetical protein